MTEGNGTTQHVHLGIFQAKNLCRDYVSDIYCKGSPGFRWNWGKEAYLLVGFDYRSKCFIEFPDSNLILGDARALERDRDRGSWCDGEVDRVDGGVG